MRKIVIIGGGTGTFTVLSGLRDYPFNLSAIVSTADDGGSTGILRDELGVLPPGDIRQALVALSPDSTVLRELLSYRFEEGGLKGHSFGNLFLSALEKVTGSFDKAVLEASHILNIAGQVIPVTNDKVHLRAEDVQGKQINGEHKIEEHIWSEAANLSRLWLEPECTVHPLAALAIRQADLIVIAPGSVFTSLIPNLLVGGVKEALLAAKAPIVYVCNVMTEKGQTGEFFVQDFAELIGSYLGKRRLDYVLYNTKVPSATLLENYKKEMERQPVRLDRRRQQNLPYKLVGANLLARRPKTQNPTADSLAKTRTLIRHDPRKLADILHAILVLKLTKKYTQI